MWHGHREGRRTIGILVKVEIDGEVGTDGMVWVAMPDLPVGAPIRITVEEKPVFKGERIFGQLKGKIRIRSNFDDPIEGMEWAY